jgi:hypothetical protein
MIGEPSPQELLEACERALREQEAYHDAQVEAIDQMHRERYAKLEAHYLRIMGVGLNSHQRYARWIEHLEDHLLFITSSPEEIERFKEDLVRRIEHYRGRTRHRRTRGRRVGSLNYTPAARREAVDEYIRLRHAGLTQDEASGRVGHWPSTLKKWSGEFGIDFI